jgi:hypothetical protein
MRAVEIHLASSELPQQMAAMRVWLDRHRVEPLSFACRDSEWGVLVSLGFRIGRQADEFAERFGGRTDGSGADEPEDDVIGEILETELSAYGVVG